ncbi:hypothetical protein SLA2020_279000 [Shorea laevis]
MEAPPWALTVTAMALLVALAFLTKILTFKRHNLKLAPGPKPWPIIGNLNLIGPLLHQSLHKLSQRYGPIMQLKFGSSQLWLPHPEMAKQFLKTHDHIFALDPKLLQGKSYEYIRVEERNALVSHLRALSGKSIRVKEHLSRLTLSIISRIALGTKYFSESDREFETSAITFKEFQQMLDEWFLLNSKLNIGDWIPWLNFLDLQGYVKRMKALAKKIDRFYDHVFDDHKVKRGVGDFVPKDMVDLLLQLVDDPNTDVKLTYDNVKALTQDLIIGGTESSATTLEWAMSELLKQPHLIRKATEELDRVIGKDRWVEEKDIPQLPYIDAIIKETMRKHPVAVMLAPHSALEDCNVAGYDVRKGSTVLINTWGMGRDPLIWDAPEEFRPERFLGKDIDVKGQYFELLPFGSGRRMCPGYSLALKVITSTLANMLRGFEWKLPDNMKPEDLSMEELYGLATSRKFPLVAITKPRLPLHLY